MGNCFHKSLSVAGMVFSVALLFAAHLSFAQFGCGDGFCNKRPASSSCTFPTLTNLVASWRASTVTPSGGNVTTVTDSSGNGYTLTNNNTVPYNATSAYNSKPAFDFVAANDAALTTDLFVPLVNLGAANRLSVFVVGRMTTSTASSGRVVSIGQGGSADYQVAGNIAALTRTGATASIETYYNGGATQVDTAMSTGANHRFGVVIDATTATHYVDNVAGSSGAITLALTTPTNIILGNIWNTGLSPTGAAWDGPIVEVDIMAAAATGTERNNLDTWFTCSYGT